MPSKRLTACSAPWAACRQGREAGGKQVGQPTLAPCHLITEDTRHTLALHVCQPAHARKLVAPERGPLDQGWLWRRLCSWASHGDVRSALQALRHLGLDKRQDGLLVGGQDCRVSTILARKPHGDPVKVSSTPDGHPVATHRRYNHRLSLCDDTRPVSCEVATVSYHEQSILTKCGTKPKQQKGRVLCCPDQSLYRRLLALI